MKVSPANVERFDLRAMLRVGSQQPTLFSQHQALPLYPRDPNDFDSEWSFVALSEGTETRSVPAKEVAPTDDVFERFRRVHRWAKAHGYTGGFPTFVDENKDGQTNYGVVLIKPGVGQEIWFPVAERLP